MEFPGRVTGRVARGKNQHQSGRARNDSMGGSELRFNFLGSMASPNGNGLCGGWTTTRSSCRRWRRQDTGKSHDDDGASEPVENTIAEIHRRGQYQCTHGQRKAISLKHFDLDYGVSWNGVVTEIIHCWTRSLGSGCPLGHRTLYCSHAASPRSARSMINVLRIWG